MSPSEMVNIFVQTLNTVAMIISQLESYKYDDSVKGINLSNWTTQIVGNSPIAYAFTLFVTLKDKKPMRIKVDENYQPALRGGDGNSNAYVGDLRNGRFENPTVELLSLIGYLLSGMLLGKPLSIVNSGRGLILDKILKDLNVIDLSLTLHGFSTGGKDKAHDVTVNYPEIKSWIKTYLIRSQLITSLPKSTGHETRPSDYTKRSNVKLDVIE